jgi:hypothetical protein
MEKVTKTHAKIVEKVTKTHAKIVEKVTKTHAKIMEKVTIICVCQRFSVLLTKIIKQPLYECA